jgi:ribonuclease HI
MTVNRTNKPKIEMWTDGSVRPSNPGPHGGWGVIFRMRDGDRVRYRAISGYIADTTNQRAELSALLFGLKVLNYPCRIQLRADSTYVLGKVKAISSRPNSRKSYGKENRDITELCKPYILEHEFVIADHVYGHADDDMNKWADAIAYNATVEKKGIDEYYAAPQRVRRIKVGYESVP